MTVKQNNKAIIRRSITEVKRYFTSTKIWYLESKKPMINFNLISFVVSTKTVSKPVSKTEL